LTLGSRRDYSRKRLHGETWQRRFEGRAVLVSGGGRGIGEAAARRFAAEGANVLVVARTRGEVESSAERIRADGGVARAFVADVADPAAVDAAVAEMEKRWQGLDVLVNCAGTDHDCPFLEFPLEEWDRVLAVNLRGAFVMAQRCARLMARTGGGVIVNIASIDAHGADGNQVAYNASKAAMLGLNRTMATELARHGIRSNTVSPGYTATLLTRQYVGEAMYEYMTTSFDRVPQRRMATPEEVAAAIAFLASDDAGAITGTDLVVDGGTIANLFVVETLPAE
jgi:NAD(P)-dependent dehydrogenase (short-subunit alcohol dehydrogenase family)